MYQMIKLSRKGLKLALLSAVLAAAIPLYASAVLQGHVAITGTTGLNNIYTSDFAIGAPASLTQDWTCDTCSSYGLSASGSAKVINGVLGAESTLSVPDASGDLTRAESDSYASFTDNLTITGGTGSGLLDLEFTVDGSITNTGGSNFSDAYLQLYSDPGADSSLNGGAVIGDDTQHLGSGSSTVDFYVPFSFGTQFSIQPYLRATAQYGTNFGSTPDAPPYTATSDFYSTAVLTSALVYTGTSGNLGTQITNASIASTTGFNYGPNGLTAPGMTAVPEPGTWLLAALALSLLVFAKGRFRKGARENA